MGYPRSHWPDHDRLIGAPAELPEMLNPTRIRYVQNDLPLRLQHEMRTLITDLGSTTTYNGVRGVGERLRALGAEFIASADSWEQRP